MQNPTLDLIHAHASVRHYLPEALPAQSVEVIVAAAQRSSTSSNLQTYSVVAVTEAAKRARLAELCGNQQHIRTAPLFLVWCADLARLERVCQLRGYTHVSDYLENFLVAAMDAVIAAQTAALAAESLGLGICYIGSIRNNPSAVIKLLELPRLVFPTTGMTIGWPERPARPKPRLPTREVLHWERYEGIKEEALQEYDQTMADSGIYQGRQVPASEKEVEMQAYGWLEHSARRVSKAERSGLREEVERQGFAIK